jgi:hypothetical protein
MKLTADEITALKAAFQNIWNAVPMQARKMLEAHHDTVRQHLAEVQIHGAKAPDDEHAPHGATKKGK